MKFMKKCVLVLQKQLVKYQVWFYNQIYQMSDHINTIMHIKSNRRYSLITVFTCSVYPIIYCATTICEPVSWFVLQTNWLVPA